MERGLDSGSGRCSSGDSQLRQLRLLVKGLVSVTWRSHSGVKAGRRGGGGCVAGWQPSWNLKVFRSLERSRRNKAEWQTQWHKRRKSQVAAQAERQCTKSRRQNNLAASKAETRVFELVLMIKCPAGVWEAAIKTPTLHSTVASVVVRSPVYSKMSAFCLSVFF